MTFTLTQLRYVLALNETRHFGLAAKKMHVSQPTLSLQIQKLEEELGGSLFDRSKQPILPTEAGERVIEQARKVLTEAKSLESMLTEEGEVHGSFKIGIIPTLSTDLLSRFVPALLKKFPKLQLSVEEVVTEEMVERLKRDELDAGLLVTPLHDSGLQEFPLFYEPLWIYLPQEHPLLKRKKVETSDLEREDLLLLSEGHCFRSQMLEVCKNRKGRKGEGNSQFHFESGSFEALIGLVDSGVGYTILPQLAMDRLISGAQKKRLRAFESPEPVREVSLVRSRQFSKKKVSDTIANQIQSQMTDHLMIKPAKHSIVPIS